MIQLFMQDTFHPDFVKEINWLMEGQFQEFLKITEKNLEEVYTPEELDILYHLHINYPWLGPKAELLAQQNAADSMEVGKKTAEIVMKNLEETGGLQKIMDEGFFINNQEEGYGLFAAPEENEEDED